MFFNSLPKRQWILLAGIMLCLSCVKTNPPSTDNGNNNNNGAGNNDNNPPIAITAIGSPAGNPVSKSIGPAGGSLKSDDGMVEISIPAGALSSNTEIKIQPVTNEAPGGVGLSYDFLPNGTIFSKPATITFHYNEDELNNDPVFLCLAYQDSIHAWRADPEHQYLDSTAKTLSLDVSHFTRYTTIDAGFKLSADPKEVKGNNTSRIQVWEILSQDNRVTTSTSVPSKYVDSWTVDFSPGGNNTVGKIVGTGSDVTYQAPEHVDVARTVKITAHIKVKLTIYFQGSRIDLPNGWNESCEIKLLPEISEYKYHITIKAVDKTISPWFGGPEQGQPVYNDNASFDLNIQLKGKLITYDTSNLINAPPSCNPPAYSYGGMSFLYIPDDFGIINIVDIKIRGVELGDDSIVHFDLVHKDATAWGFKSTVDADGSKAGGQEPLKLGGTTGFPQWVEVDLKRKDTYIDPSTPAWGIPDSEYITVTISPK